MPDTITTVAPLNTPPPKPYPNPKEKELSDAIQIHFTNHEPLRIAFYQDLCGWRLVDKPQETTQALTNKKKIIMIEDIVIDYNSRIMNESGANYIYGATLPLISAVMQTSKLSKMQIFNMWNARFYALVFNLLDSYFKDGNPYEIRDCTKIPEITSFFLSLSGISSKAEEGFFMRESSESYQTVMEMKMGQQKEHEKPKGIVDGFLHSLPFNKGN